MTARLWWIVAAVLVTTCLGAGAAPAARSDCEPLPEAVLGNYIGVANQLTLHLGGDCTFTAYKKGGAFDGGGTYTVTSGDASSGQVVFSNDHGCDAGQDVPATYAYTRTPNELSLALAQPVDECSGRSRDLVGSYVRGIEGLVSLTLAASRFTLTGAAAVSGSVTVLRQTKAGTGFRRTISLRAQAGTLTLVENVTRAGRITWSVVAATGVFVHVNGQGSGTRRGTRQTLRGNLSNASALLRFDAVLTVPATPTVTGPNETLSHSVRYTFRSNGAIAGLVVDGAGNAILADDNANDPKVYDRRGRPTGAAGNVYVTDGQEYLTKLVVGASPR